MKKYTTQLIITILLLAIAGLVAYQYYYLKPADTSDFKIETPAGTIKGSFESKQSD